MRASLYAMGSGIRPEGETAPPPFPPARRGGGLHGRDPRALRRTSPGVPSGGPRRARRVGTNDRGVWGRRRSHRPARPWLPCPTPRSRGPTVSAPTGTPGDGERTGRPAPPAARGAKALADRSGSASEAFTHPRNPAEPGPLPTATNGNGGRRSFPGGRRGAFRVGRPETLGRVSFSGRAGGDRVDAGATLPSTASLGPVGLGLGDTG